MPRGDKHGGARLAVRPDDGRVGNPKAGRPTKRVSIVMDGDRIEVKMATFHEIAERKFASMVQRARAGQIAFWKTGSGDNARSFAITQLTSGELEASAEMYGFPEISYVSDNGVYIVAWLLEKSGA